MLNAIPLPTGPTEIPGGMMKAERTPSSPGQDRAGEGTESFASTLKAVHDKSQARGNDTNRQAEKSSCPRETLDSEEIRLRAEDRQTSSDEIVAPMDQGETIASIIPTAAVDAETMEADKASAVTQPMEENGMVDETMVNPKETMGHPQPGSRHLAATGDQSLTAVEAPEKPQGHAAEIGEPLSKETMASPSASGEAPADSSETAPKAPVDVSDPPHRIVGAAKDMSEGKKTAEATQSQVDGLTEKAPKIENAQLAGDKDAGEKNMSDLAQFAKHLRDKEGGNQKGDSRVPSVRTISSETQEILDGKSRTAETPSEHPKATDGPVRETHVAMVNDEHNPVAGRQGAVDPAMPLQTSSAIGKAAVSSPGTGMTTTITPTAESFHQDNFHQLVERAMFSVRGGQSEARIALKPDHLGHVQLQILTEHHHVNIKIMTESPVTRDLIDAHAHHLKTELQQQGLNVESIEVSVSDDQRDAYRGARQRESFLRHMTSRGAAEEDETGGRSKPVTGQRQPGRSRVNGIDYFA